MKRKPVRTLLIASGFSVLFALGFSQSCPAQEQTPANAWTFPTPEDASRALFKAVQKHDDRAILQILHGEKDLISLGDKEADKRERENFVEKYQEMHRLVHEPNGVTVLYIGAENWPLPIPLVSKKGRWTFDGKAAKREVLFRQIGSNEMTAIAVCHELVAAAKGEKAAPGEAASDDLKNVINNDAERKTAAGEEKPTPFHGYYFRQLAGDKKSETKAAPDALVAYPAAYRACGVMTFIVNEDGIVYQKDLGPNTAKLARAMAGFKKDAGWQPAETQQVSGP